MIQILIFSYIAFNLYGAFLSYLDLKYREIKKRLLLPLLVIAISLVIYSKVPLVIALYDFISLSLLTYIKERISLSKFIKSHNLSDDDLDKLEEIGYKTKFGAVDIIGIGIFCLASGWAYLYFLIGLFLFFIIISIIKVRRFPFIVAFEITFLISTSLHYFILKF